MQPSAGPALALFQRSSADSRCGRALAQVGLAEKALGRGVDAEAHLREALASKGESWIERNRQTLDGELAACGAKVGDLDVTVDGGNGGIVPGATLAIDGREVGSLPLRHPVRVAAGTVAVAVRAPGFVPVSRPVVVPAAGLARESIRLTAASVSGATKPVDQKPPNTRSEPAPVSRPAIAVAPRSPASPPPVPRSSDPAVPSARRPAVLGAGVALGVAGVGLLAGAVNVLARIFFSIFVPYGSAVILAFPVALTVAFVLNREHVFRTTLGSQTAQYLKFTAVNVLALAQVWLISVVLVVYVFGRFPNRV